MGMAASQARFLSVTARKNNVEYEAQQINQERTVLSNQSATYFNSLLGLNVPTPPSTDQFTKTVHSFNQVKEGENSYKTINQISKNSSNTFTIAYSYTAYDYNIQGCSDKDKIAIKNDAGTYYKDTTKLLEYGEISEGDKIQFEQTATALACAQENLRLLKTPMGDGSFNYKYFKTADLPADGNTQPSTYHSWAQTETYATGYYDNCTITRDVNGNLISFTPNGSTEAIAVNTSTIKDQEEYERAYSQYKYETYMYDQKMAEINAHIEIVQTQDKTLELRLKQLDTEQNALSTEMESLEKVIDKNLEDSFKTFA